jgi:predicted nuclease with TOPRIM domain
LKIRKIEASKRLRQEIADLKQKIEYSYKENEESAIMLKRKHQEHMNEINNHLELLSKAKIKAERDNKGFIMQVEDFRKENDNLAKSRVGVTVINVPNFKTINFFFF